MPKRKGKSQDNSHFISRLPLEECTRRLNLLSDDAVHVQITTMTSDKVAFIARVYDEGLLRVEGEGHLMRWEGTLTRVTCQITAVHDGVLPWALLMSAMAVLPLMLVALLVASTINIESNTPLLIILLAISLALLLALLTAAGRYAPFDDTPPNLAQIIEQSLVDDRRLPPT